MKNLIVFVLALTCAQSNAGTEGGNGGGIAEKFVLQAYASLERYINFCFNAPECTLTAKEKSVLVAIKKSLPEERKTKDQIQFKSEKLNPRFFHIDGLVRIAKTGNAVGSTIYVNSDLLYVVSPNDISPISFATAVATLIHEMGHHHGIKDHLFLDNLGLKVHNVILNLASTAEAPAPIGKMRATLHRGPDRDYDLFAYSALHGDNIIQSAYADLSDTLDQVQCEDGSKPNNTEALGLYMPYERGLWSAGNWVSNPDISVFYKLVVVLNYRCQDPMKTYASMVSMTFHYKVKSSVIELVNNSVRVTRVNP